MAATEQSLQAVKAPSLMAKFAGKFSVEPGKMMSTLKRTAFRQQNGEVTDEQMMALIIVADQYGLNPFTRELFAFPDKGGIVPVVSVDGWARIINDHPQFDGVEFIDGPEDGGGVPAWIECVIYRKDRQHPTRIRERFKEVKRGTQPWQSHPSRMLRHKALIQCARVAFGFSGIYDEDEAQRIVDVTEAAQVVDRQPLTAQVRRASEARQAETVIDADPAVGGLDDIAADVGAAEQAADDSDSDETYEGPSYAELLTMIDKATTPDRLDEIRDLARGLPDPAMRTAIGQKARTRLKALQEQQ